jgi:16S RNA G1207 methylase RsmC
MNRRATGDPAIDWINHSAGLLVRFAKAIKALSVGCGFGVIERILRSRDFCQPVHGVDVAENAIGSARKTAEASSPLRRMMSFMRTRRCIIFFTLSTFSTKLNKH